MAAEAGLMQHPSPPTQQPIFDKAACDQDVMTPDPKTLDHIKDDSLEHRFSALQAQAERRGGGFLTDEARKYAWPALLGTETSSHDGETGKTPWQQLPPHRDEEQVRLDVNRSFVYYPAGESDKQLDARRVELEELIVETLRRNPSLNYFQGYHDIVQVFLLVLGKDAAVPLVRRLSLLRIRDFMLPKLSASVSHLQLLPAILKKADPAIFKILPANPFYGLAHVLTLYAHDIQSYQDIARLFDFLLAEPAIMTIYLFAAIIISKREQLLELMADEPDDDVMSVILQKLPDNLDLESMILHAQRLYQQHKPQDLDLRPISKYSVLKTTEEVERLRTQPLAEGQALYDLHAEELRKAEARQKMVLAARRTLFKYRRPLGFALSAAVCVVAVWLNWSGHRRSWSIFAFSWG